MHDGSGQMAPEETGTRRDAKALYFFARSAITKHHRLNDFNNRNLFPPVLEATVSRSRYQQEWFLLKASFLGL